MKLTKKGQISRYSRADRNSFPFVYILIALPVLQFLVFWVYVNANSFALAFTNDTTHAFTLENFQNVWANVTSFGDKFNIPTMMLRSLILWATSNILAFPLGILSTYVLYKRVIGHYAFRIIYMVPGLVGAVVWTTMIANICSANNSLLFILQKFGFDNQDAIRMGLLSCKETAFPTLVIMAFVTGCVGGSVIATGAFTKVPPELVDAAKIDGLDFWGTFFHVSLPCSWPTISTLLTLSLCSIFVADGNVFLYTSGTGEPAMATMGFYLYKLAVDISQSTATVLPYGYPAALGICISLVTVPVVLLGRALLNRIVPTTKV
ncbi:MAG: ABC transporter permease subunit [Bacilli bacterium]|nr:ABC transporter permease subunit [Bacilli bacterium]